MLKIFESNLETTGDRSLAIHLDAFSIEGSVQLTLHQISKGKKVKTFFSETLKQRKKLSFCSSPNSTQKLFRFNFIKSIHLKFNGIIFQSKNFIFQKILALNVDLNSAFCSDCVKETSHLNQLL